MDERKDSVRIIRKGVVNRHVDGVVLDDSTGRIALHLAHEVVTTFDQFDVIDTPHSPGYLPTGAPMSVKQTWTLFIHPLRPRSIEEYEESGKAWKIKDTAAGRFNLTANSLEELSKIASAARQYLTNLTQDEEVLRQAKGHLVELISLAWNDQIIPERSITP